MKVRMAGYIIGSMKLKLNSQKPLLKEKLCLCQCEDLKYLLYAFSGWQLSYDTQRVAWKTLYGELEGHDREASISV